MSDFQSPLTATAVRRICLDNGLDISDSQWQLLEKWAALLLELNQKINLISRKETEFLWEKQILPCLALLIFRKFSTDTEVCDFGTGGGLPGIILAIVRPDLRLTLLDSRHKKIEVVQQMIHSLKSHLCERDHEFFPCGLFYTLILLVVTFFLSFSLLLLELFDSISPL